MVSGRLNEHLIKNCIFDPLQSAYRDKHSTQTALSKVQNDIEDAVSGDQELGFGVPQGSVLGSKMYCMYTKPVSDIIQ